MLLMWMSTLRAPAGRSVEPLRACRPRRFAAVADVGGASSCESPSAIISSSVQNVPSTSTQSAALHRVEHMRSSIAPRPGA